jgi:hypothetical protein
MFLSICQGVVLVHMISDTLASSFCHCKAQDSSFYSEQAPQSPRILPGKYGGRELEGGENSPPPRPSPVKGEGISAGLAPGLAKQAD